MRSLPASTRFTLSVWLSLAAMPAPAQIVAPAVPVEDRARATECLALAVAYEAGREPLAGQQAVAEVVLNRVRDPAFPKTVCGVVFAGSTRRTGCQFTFTCDGSLARAMPAALLAAARAVAEAAIDGRAPSQVGGATHYHADYVRPYWAPTLIRLGRIGTHIFYRGAHGGAGTPGASIPLAAMLPAESPPATAAPFAPWGLTASVR